MGLETTYTAKCAAALIDRARAGRLEEPVVLFWNTHSSVDLSALLPPPGAWRELPAPLQRFVRPTA